MKLADSSDLSFLPQAAFDKLALVNKNQDISVQHDEILQ